MWYVIQVRTGEEEKTLQLCRERLNPSSYEELFLPYFMSQRRYQGAWHPKKRILFPGYLFLDTEKIDQIIEELRKVDTLTKVLGDGDGVIPVSEQEQQYLQSLMDEEHIVQISVGYMIGQRIEIIDGPLRECPAVVRKVDRHKRLAEIDVELFGRYTRAQVGLEIIRRVPDETSEDWFVEYLNRS